MNIDSTIQSATVHLKPVSEIDKIIKNLSASSIFMLADENTNMLCIPLLSNVNANTIIIQSGEEHKNLETCIHIWSRLIELGADKDSLLLNVGGGVVTDIGGFAATCYQRGIRFANIPTTVMGMADAALGGKNGIDFKHLKNYIGTITKPEFVWIDEIFLNTLDRKEKISGLAEVVKHAIIGSTELWRYLSGFRSVDELNWKTLLQLSVPVKLTVTESDPLDKGYRKILNFGHTVGHALESYFLERSIYVTHGQCVTLGMLAETKMANATGLLNNTDFNTIIELIKLLLEPAALPLPSFDQISKFISRDKKNTASGSNYSLPDRIGSCQLNVLVKDHVVVESYSWLTQALAPPERF